jgi:hypothetical protein
MLFVPYKRQTFTTTLSADTLRQRMEEYLARGTFKGTATAEGFRVVLVTPWRRDIYQPWVLGQIRASGDVSEVDVTYTLRPLAFTIMGFILLMVLRQFFSAYSWRGILLLGILHCGFYLISFQPLVRQLDDIFRTMLQN